MNLRYLRTIDWFLLIVPLFAVSFGIAILFSFSFSEKNLAIYQLIYAALGIVALVVLSLFDYRSFKGMAWYLYFVDILLLVLVLVIGNKVFGARRWLDLGIFQLQPSELMKLFLILSVAKVLPAISRLQWKTTLFIFLILAIPTLLVLRQPDLGTAAVMIVVVFAMLAYSKAPKFFWLALIIVGILSVPLAWSRLKPYQRDRLYAFMYPSHDPGGIGYNVAQAKIAIGAGGIWGRGLGQGSQSQLNFLPVAHTDFIFSAIAESSGFIGSAVLILLLSAVVWRSLVVASLSQDEYGRFVALGIATMLGFQIIVNTGMNLGLLPVTGIPLPFVSFGGSGMIVNFAAVGILQSIFMRHKKIRFG